MVIFFNQPVQALQQAVDAQTFRLGCTPVINLFEQTAEPEVSVEPGWRGSWLVPVAWPAERPSRPSPSLAQMLHEHRRRQDAELVVNPARDAEDLVFRAPGGEWLTPERFTRVLERLIEQSGVPRITPNGLRQVGRLVG